MIYFSASDEAVDRDDGIPGTYGADGRSMHLESEVDRTEMTVDCVSQNETSIVPDESEAAGMYDVLFDGVVCYSDHF